MTPASLPAKRRLSSHLPLLILFAVQLAFGLLTFRDYGLSWDEPLFYKYADALGYAYTPANWFAPDFDLDNAYGPSGDDHKTRGPAYLLLAREPVYALESLGVDEASAWHLVNFLTFLLGVYLLYRLSLRWMGEWAALGAAALFSTQPLLLGHALINPKDMPFLVFFTGALLFGFEMVDNLNSKTKNVKRKLLGIVAAAFFLGVATSIRVLAPLAGILVVIYAIIRQPPTTNRQQPNINQLPLTIHLLTYTILASLFLFAAWPYLWEAPLKNFIYVFRFMSENPTGLQVLFGGEVYRAYELPRRYLPTLLAITLTEPVWPLFFIGFGVSFWKLVVSVRSKFTRYSTTARTINHDPSSTGHWLLLTAFFIPFAYVLLRQPPMYDGFRHFLFILPPVFVACGLAMEVIGGWLEKIVKRIIVASWLRAVLILALLLPGLIGAARLHPYEYAYYNSFVGGTGGAFRTYETDYWLTCYKEAVETVASRFASLQTIFVHREAYIAAYYAPGGLTILDERGNLSAIRPGDLILVNSRTNEDRKTFHDAPVVLTVERNGATFCVIKRIP